MHSFKFHFEGEDFYPSVSVITEKIYKVHFYKSIDAYALPSIFTLDTESLIVTLEDNRQINKCNCPFVKAFKKVLTEHLCGIRQRF